MVTSQQDISYKDTGLEIGKTYYYTVSAKDISGKESVKSSAIDVLLEETVVVEKEKQVLSLALKIARTKKGASINFVDDFPLTPVRTVEKGADGYTWMVVGKGFLLALDDDLKLVESVRLKTPESMRSNMDFIVPDIAFSEDGSIIYYTMPLGKFVVAAERSNGDVIWAKQYRYPEKDEDPELFERRPGGTFDSPKPNVTAITVLQNGDLYVSDEKSPFRFVIDADNGELIEWQESYHHPTGELLSGNPAHQMRTLPDGSVMVVEPIGKRILVIDPETGTYSKILGQIRSGDLGGFLGIGGYSILEDQNWIVAADPAYGTVQVFDLETGSYLFHLGDPTGKPDPKDGSRASYEWSFPNWPIIYAGGTKMLLLNGLEKSFFSYDITDSMVDMGSAVVEQVKKNIAEREAKKAAGK
jgi:outer membrane protein assembly factor BamB